jgi:F-type H+-transporting ATPase subunit a
MRLFANMMAGHMILVVFASFAVILGSLGAAGILGAIIPFAVNIPLIGFELLVALLQAYVFAILTCIYLHDAVHLH